MNTWNDLLRDYFKVDLDTDEIARWYEEVNNELHTSPTELENAIRFAATHKDWNKFDGKPALKDLMIWVKWYRKNRRMERDGTLSASTKDGFIAMLKSRILNASSHMERRNILCDPQIYCGAKRTTTFEECQILEAFCEEKYKDWKRPTIDDLIAEYARAHPVKQEAVAEEVDDFPFESDRMGAFEKKEQEQ
jgi:hypothetical protein